jgi:hypothetical protein
MALIVCIFVHTLAASARLKSPHIMPILLLVYLAQILLILQSTHRKGHITRKGETQSSWPTSDASAGYGRRAAGRRSTAADVFPMEEKVHGYDAKS